jgi:hypothetical protein
MNIKIVVISLYLYMTKGKKLYVLEILYNDETNEVLSIYESVDKMDNINPMFDAEGNPIDKPNEKTYYLSDFIDEKYFDLIADSNVIGFC